MIYFVEVLPSDYDVNNIALTKKSLWRLRKNNFGTNNTYIIEIVQ